MFTYAISWNTDDQRDLKIGECWKNWKIMEGFSEIGAWGRRIAVLQHPNFKEEVKIL
jgi:hypothetical protein